MGFHRRRPGQIDRAFKRGHCYSAVFLNIELLHSNDVFYDKRVWLWEDLDFNRRANEKGLVICKCYRFQQEKIKLAAGGCGELVARPPTREPLGPPEAADTQLVPASAAAGNDVAAYSARDVRASHPKHWEQEEVLAWLRKFDAPHVADAIEKRYAGRRGSFHGFMLVNYTIDEWKELGAKLLDAADICANVQKLVETAETPGSAGTDVATADSAAAAATPVE